MFFKIHVFASMLICKGGGIRACVCVGEHTCAGRTNENIGDPAASLSNLLLMCDTMLLTGPGVRVKTSISHR